MNNINVILKYFFVLVFGSFAVTSFILLFDCGGPEEFIFFMFVMCMSLVIVFLTLKDK